MSAATQPTTFSDLYTDLQNRVRLQTSVTATETQAKRYINIALQDMHIGYGEKFPWAERHAILVTQPEYTTGTVSINQGSTTLTGSGTAWDTANAFSVNNARAGGKVVIAGGTEIYEVASVGSDTSITLTSMYTQSDASAASYAYFEDEYALDTDFLRPFDIQFFDEARSIHMMGRREFRLRYPRSKITGKPRVAMTVDRAFSGSTTPVRKVVLWKPPDAAYTLPYNFVTNKLVVQSDGTEAVSLSGDTDEPIVPLRYRHAIIFHALYHWYRDKKDDTRSQEARGEYTDLVTRIGTDTEIGQSRPHIQPRLSSYASSAHRPYRRRSGRYTTGTRFDEIR